MALAANRDSAGRPQLVRSPSPAFGPPRALLVAMAGLCVIAVAARFLAAPLDRFDEGLTLTKAALVAHGLIPYRDFWSTYGPLDMLVLGSAFRVIAVDALVERGLAIASVLLFAGTAYALITVTGVRGALRLLMTSLLALVALSIPAFNSAVLADLLLLGAFAVFLRGQLSPDPPIGRRRLGCGARRAEGGDEHAREGIRRCVTERAQETTPGSAASAPKMRVRLGGFGLTPHRGWALAAGALTALASFARPELGAALGLGLGAGYALAARLERRPGPLLAYVATAGLGVALLWGPVVLVAGPSPIYVQLVQSTVTVYARARHIPLGQGHEGPVVAVMAGAFALTWIWAVRTLWLRKLPRPEMAAALAFLITGVLLFGWVWTRADGAHALTAWPATGALLVLLLQQRRHGLPLQPRLEAAMSVVALASLALAAGGLTIRDLNLPTNRLAMLVRRIDQQVPAGQPLFVGLQRNDLALFNDTTLYFLSDRRPGTVYFENLPGLSNLDAVQQTVICQLERSHVTLAVLGPNGPGEPWNLSSHPGSTRLDAWLRAHASARETIDPYELITLRQDGAAPTAC